MDYAVLSGWVCSVFAIQSAQIVFKCFYVKKRLWRQRRKMTTAFTVQVTVINNIYYKSYLVLIYFHFLCKSIVCFFFTKNVFANYISRQKYNSYFYYYGIPVFYRNCFDIHILSPSISIILNPSSPSAISNLFKLGLNAKPIDGAEL